MKSLIDVLKLSTSYLQQRNMQQPRRLAEEVIADALGIKRLELYMQFDRPMIESELELCRLRLARCAKGEPIQYIRGDVEFLNCSIKVTPAVLIPRQETEILVDKIIQELSQCDLSNKILWDICCGSGCIGISLKKKFPELQIVSSDLSADALAIARENAKSNAVDVTFLEGDLLNPFDGKQANFVVCNPPYIATHELEKLDSGVRDHEPKMALISGTTGLEFYERLAQGLPSHLLPHSKVWFEMGKGQGNAIKEIFNGAFWKSCRVEKDWAGHDRFFFLENE